MKQSSNKKSREATAFLYERLSRDDNLEGESYSIGNQKKLLTKVAKEKGYTVKWQGKQKPIVLEKDGTSIEITLGSAEYVVEGDMVMKVAMPSELKDGKTYVSSEIFN